MLDVTKYPPSAHGFTCRNCGGGDRGRVAIYCPFGEVSLSLNRTVTCMVLKANDRRTSCPCHDEFRSDYVRQGYHAPVGGRAPQFEKHCTGPIRKYLKGKTDDNEMRNNGLQVLLFGSHNRKLCSSFLSMMERAHLPNRCSQFSSWSRVVVLKKRFNGGIKTSKWYWARSHDLPSIIRYRGHWVTAAPSPADIYRTKGHLSEWLIRTSENSFVRIHRIADPKKEKKTRFIEKKRHGIGGEGNILQPPGLVVSAATAHKTFGLTDLRSMHSVCTWRVFGDIEPRPSGLESDALTTRLPRALGLISLLNFHSSHVVHNGDAHGSQVVMVPISKFVIFSRIRAVMLLKTFV
ncbi:uncharacterized protein TNCV_4604401 [Trichonephila clavipes]|nr:uncharacterized protein TNCV_4604401 [Trichonephila clavipes]